MLSFLQPIMQRPNFNLPRTPSAESGVVKCEKPSLSYQTLIARAIMSAGGSLTLAGIYSYIMESHLYFRTTQDNWRNRVRHTLTVCKCFKRMATTSSRRGGLWTIDTEYRSSFTADWTYVGANNRPTQASSPLNSLERPNALASTRSCPTTPDTVRFNRMENPTTQLLLPTYNQDPFGQTKSEHASPEISRAARLRAVCTAPDTYYSPGPDAARDFWGDLNGDFDDFQDPLDVLDHPYDPNQPYPVNGMASAGSGGNLSPTSQLHSNQAALLSKLDEIQHQRLHADDLRRQVSPYSIGPRNSAPAMVLHSATIDKLTQANQTAQAQEFTALAYQRFSLAEQGEGGENAMNLTADDANSLLSSYNAAMAAQQQHQQQQLEQDGMGAGGQGMSPISEEQAVALTTLDIDFSMLSLSQLGNANGLAGIAMKQEPGSSGDLNAGQGSGNAVSMFSMENLDPVAGLAFDMPGNANAVGEVGSRPGSADLPEEEDSVGDLPVMQAFKLEGPKTVQSMENFNKVLSMLKSEKS
eukprot:comp23724_c0_seq1/m.40882 comp23724_c0_seq1/g.40882  ORF comp23724_c0_seq1/g.40882 comp23724_c0_seq1/m.40882 type:complete len:526 (-) comp23724_c0_seq1:123-1700(-)